jgi:hypothetical protein
LLKIEQEVTELRQIVPQSISEEVLKRATTLSQPLSLNKASIAALRAQSPQAWKKDISQLSESSLDRCLEIFSTYSGDPNFRAISRQAVKETVADTQKCLLACYAYFLAAQGTAVEPSMKKVLEKLISHPSQREAFNAMVTSHSNFDLALVRKLESLTHAPVRSVSLDSSKVQAARLAHEDALRRVEGYLGEDTDSTEPAAQTHENITLEGLFGVDGVDRNSSDIQLSAEQFGLLQEIDKSGYSLDLIAAEAYAKSQHKFLSNLITGINQSYYEEIEDQLIATVDGKITVETMYRQRVKENLSAANPA